jgi:hypothetical protein
VRNNPYPAPLNSGRIGDFFAYETDESRKRLKDIKVRSEK